MACINRGQGLRLLEAKLARVRQENARMVAELGLREQENIDAPACFGTYSADFDACFECDDRERCRLEHRRVATLASQENPSPTKPRRKRAPKPKPVPPPEKLPLRKILIKALPGEEHNG